MNYIKQLLAQVESGMLGADEAYKQFKRYEDVGGIAKVDIEDAKRTGFPEVFTGKGKQLSSDSMGLEVKRYYDVGGSRNSSPVLFCETDVQDDEHEQVNSECPES
jgi:NCAIR mutase (PurE)-related protein